MVIDEREIRDQQEEMFDGFTLTVDFSSMVPLLWFLSLGDSVPLQGLMRTCSRRATWTIIFTSIKADIPGGKPLPCSSFHHLIDSGWRLFCHFPTMHVKDIGSGLCTFLFSGAIIFIIRLRSQFTSVL